MTCTLLHCNIQIAKFPPSKTWSHLFFSDPTHAADEGLMRIHVLYQPALAANVVTSDRQTSDREMVTSPGLPALIGDGPIVDTE